MPKVWKITDFRAVSGKFNKFLWLTSHPKRYLLWFFVSNSSKFATTKSFPLIRSLSSVFRPLSKFVWGGGSTPTALTSMRMLMKHIKLHDACKKYHKQSRGLTDVCEGISRNFETKSYVICSIQNVKRFESMFYLMLIIQDASKSLSIWVIWRHVRQQQMLPQLK